jgi:WD40 repeat protein
VSLKGHQATVRTLKFHPMASGLLASAGADQCVKLWDCNSAASSESSCCLTELSENPSSGGDLFGDWPVSMDWSYDGALLAVSCRDGFTRYVYM